MGSYEQTIFDLIQTVKAQLRSQPLNLGGTSAYFGGAGGPPGGFIGYLPQSRVAYDQSESATLTLNPSGVSLVDNLNKIRYRLGVLEASGVGGSGGAAASGIKITGSAFSQTGVTTLDLQGVTLAYLGGGTVRATTHDAVTITDTATIDLVLSSQALSANVIPGGIKLDDLGTPDDNTDLNASSTRHGLLPKLSNNASTYLNGVGSWVTVSGVTTSGTSSSSLSLLQNNSLIVSGVTSIDIVGATVTNLGSGGSRITITTSGGTFTESCSIWSSDSKPATSNAKDDEFDDSSVNTSLWTTFDPNGAALHATEDERGLVFTGDTDSNDKICGLVQTVPSAPYSAWTKVHQLHTPEAGDDIKCGIILLQGTTASSDIITHSWSAAQWSKAYQIEWWNDYDNNFNSSYANEAVDYWSPSIYLRVRDLNDGLIRFDYSRDGVGWIEYRRPSKPFTISHIGLFIRATACVNDAAVFSFFRVTSSGSNSQIMEGNRIKIAYK